MTQSEITKPGPLARIEEARRLLAEARTVDEVKDVRDRAAAAAFYARERGYSQEIIDYASEIKVRAERKAGDLLTETVRPGNPQLSANTTIGTPRLSELGITRDQSSQWQQLARIPEPDFEEAVQHAKEEHRVSTSRVLDVHYSSASIEWYTPQSVIDSVVRAIGRIDLDPCADPDRVVPAVQHYTEADDGLQQPWFGRVYMNPPYGDVIVKWVVRLNGEYRAGRVTEAIALVPARTDTAWWQELRDCAVCFVRGWLRFSGHENSAPFPSAAAYFGANPSRFIQAFTSLGDVWGRYE